ncbi:MAG: hypothetical protein MUP85_18390 [Candidatus Lokiarchaeota archaeon]|nr:hypothetical protein [Candidatus Lokiarchaeota archaeon]
MERFSILKSSIFSSSLLKPSTIDSIHSSRRLDIGGIIIWDRISAAAPHIPGIMDMATFAPV